MLFLRIPEECVVFPAGAPGARYVWSILLGFCQVDLLGDHLVILGLATLLDAATLLYAATLLILHLLLLLPAAASAASVACPSSFQDPHSGPPLRTPTRDARTPTQETHSRYQEPHSGPRLVMPGP